MKRTGGVIATILTSIFLGIPGIFLGLFGLIAVIVPSTQSPADQQLGSLVLMGGGVILMLIPIIVGATTLRKKKMPAPITSVPSAPITPAPSVQPVIVQASPPHPVPVHVSPSIPDPAPSIPTPLPVVSQPNPSDPSTEVRNSLLALNRPTAPYQIVDGKSEGVDLIAEWKIVDAEWKEIFAKAKLSKVFRIFLKFDPAKREVRAMDREYTLQWRAGIPSLSVETSFFKGQQSSISLGTGYAFTETLAPGQVYKYKFNTNELKKPIQDAVAAAGWRYKGVAFGKL